MFRVQLDKNFVEVVLVPVDLRTQPRQLPNTVHLSVPVLDERMTVASVLYRHSIWSVSLVRSANLVVTNDLRLGNALELIGTHEVLGSDQRVAQERWRAHHANKLLG